MKCSQAQPNLLDFSRGRLSPLEARPVKEHLEQCAECRAVLEGELALAGRLAAVPLVSPTKDVWQMVESRIDKHPNRGFDLASWLRVYSRRVAAVGAAFLIILTALVMTSPWNNTTGNSEKDSIHKAAALMQVQPAGQQSDEQLTGTTDDMMKVIEREL